MKYRLNPNQKRLPFGGHHFVEDGMTIKGETVDDVVELLENFRIINGRPIGDPRQEIIDYYAENFPWMVEYDLDPDESTPPTEEYLNWRSWLLSIWGKPHGKTISRKEASMRWEICRKCPHNVGRPWKDTRESVEFDRKSLLLRRGEKVDEKLCYCSLHCMDISVSSFVESPGELSRKPKDKPDFPECWINKSEGP